MKPYVKPELFYESFEMNQSIAACEYDMNLMPEKGCTGEWDIDLDNSTEAVDKLLFLEETVACKSKVMDYCYFNANNSINTFQS